MEDHHNLVPQVLDALPPKALKVEWVNRGGTTAVDMGNELKPAQVRDPPDLVHCQGIDNNQLYTLLMVDVDPTVVEGQDNDYEVLHWVVFNILGNDVTGGMRHAEYIGSLPRKDTGLHRYVYFLFKQPGHITPHDAYYPRNGERRKPFHTRKFAEEYNLGAPVAGNYYIAQYDDTVPGMRAEILKQS